MKPFIIKDDKADQFFEKCKNSGLSKERRQELMKHSKMIREVKQMENNESIAYAENIELQKKLADAEREQNRLRYMATGYAGLIAMTKDTELISKAAQIATEADKLY